MDAFLAFSQRAKAVVDSVLGTIAAIMLLVLTLFALLEIVRSLLLPGQIASLSTLCLGLLEGDKRPLRTQRTVMIEHAFAFFATRSKVA